MRDQGLQEAIRVAGGISALARLLGVSQPSISEWTRIPAERVAAVEGATSVPRAVLRPDLFGPDLSADADETADMREVDVVDATRAQLYLLLSHLVLRVPEERLLIDLRRLNGDDTPLGECIRALADMADVPGAERIAREHFDLFIGVGRGELLPYASYYLTGFLYERPLVRLRHDMRRLGMERGENLSEPEDHIGFVLEMMAGLVARRIDAERNEEHRFFERHLKPWAERFFDDLAKASGAKFYGAVGRLGKQFMMIEREAFALDGEISDTETLMDAPVASAIEGARA